MQERIFRFGTTGLTFVLATLFGYWLIGGNILTIGKTTDEKITSLIILLISSPSLGFVLSSINKHLWEHFFPKEKIDLFRNSNISLKGRSKKEKEILKNSISNEEQEYLKIIYSNFKDNSGILFENDLYKIIDKHIVFLNQQVLLRKSDDNKEILAWAARRMDTFYVHVNGIYSITLGTLFGIIINCLYLKDIFREFDLPKLLSIFAIGIYFYVAFVQAKKALAEACELEKKFLIQKYNEHVGQS